MSKAIKNITSYRIALVSILLCTFSMPAYADTIPSSWLYIFLVCFFLPFFIGLIIVGKGNRKFFSLASIAMYSLSISGLLSGSFVNALILPYIWLLLTIAWKLKSNRNRIIFLVFLLIVLALIDYFSGHFFTRNNHSYKEFCQSFVPQIEQYKQKYGTYPYSWSKFNKPEKSFFHQTAKCTYANTKNSYQIVLYFGKDNNFIFTNETKKWVKKAK